MRATVGARRASTRPLADNMSKGRTRLITVDIREQTGNAVTLRPVLVDGGRGAVLTRGWADVTATDNQDDWD